MSEKRLVIDQLGLNYSGVFSVSALYKKFIDWFHERGYEMFEKKNTEEITPTGRNIELELRPYKRVTSYAKNEIRIKVFITNVKEVVIDKDGTKNRLNQGDIEILFDGYVETDYENRWENKPYFYFFRALIDKYVWRIYTDKFETMIVTDVHHLHTKIKAFLNLYRY